MESFDGKELILRPGFASNTFLTKLRAFRKNEIFTDIKIHLIRDPDYDDLPEDYQETTIFAHKVLLSSISPYFEAMFSHGFSEANQNQVTIKGKRANVLKMVHKKVQSCPIYCRRFPQLCILRND